jgi:hypothetical protein
MDVVTIEEDEDEYIYIINYDINNYDYIKELLNKNKIIIIYDMIHINGSYIFIIICTDKFAFFLKANEVINFKHI